MVVEGVYTGVYTGVNGKRVQMMCVHGLWLWSGCWSLIVGDALRICESGL